MDDFGIDKDNSQFVHSSQFKNIMASSIPSLILRPILHPLDVLKIRFQLGRSYSNLSFKETIRILSNTEGWPVLFRGFYYSQFVSVTSSVLQFTMYRNFRTVLHQSPLKESVQTCDFLAGFLMGATSSVLLNPLDVVRTVLLAREKNNTNGVLDITKNIYKNGNIGLFYSGAFTGVWHVGMLNGLRFMFYNMCCRIEMKYRNVKSHKDLTSVQLIGSGVIAAFLANFISYPFDSIKRRMQFDKTRIPLLVSKKINHGSVLCLAMVQCVLGIARTEGFSSFYNGFLPNATRSIISTAVQFSCYDIIYNWIEDLVD